MAYIVDATNANAPLASDYSGPYTAEELRAIKAYYLSRFTSITDNLNSLNLAAGTYLKKAGDTVTGQLFVPSVPVGDDAATSKQYVDALVATILSGISGGVINQNIFIGLRIDSAWNLVVDYGSGSWIADAYDFWHMMPSTASVAINSNGEVILSF